jgi:hypothetical protein
MIKDLSFMPSSGVKKKTRKGRRRRRRKWLNHNSSTHHKAQHLSLKEVRTSTSAIK